MTKNVVSGELRILRELQHCTACGKPTYIFSKSKTTIKDCTCTECNCKYCRLKRGFL